VICLLLNVANSTTNVFYSTSNFFFFFFFFLQTAKRGGKKLSVFGIVLGNCVREIKKFQMHTFDIFTLKMD
jgi:hypothetical protein